jgi:hydroxymethylbilane synthase
MHSPLRIGTRGSQLALWQARAVATRLEAAGVEVELVIIKTSGDRLQEAPLSEVGGKRLFVKEIEDALVRDEIDAAVHSAKDMPADLPDGLAIAATLSREDPRDAFVLPADHTNGDVRSSLAGLGRPPRVGTSSVRRTAQLSSVLPGAVFAPIRGNVDTRLRKLDAGEYDVLVLAAAGLRRLGFSDRISGTLSPDECVPAPGQGIVAVEIRADDSDTRRALRAVHDPAAATTLDAERTVVSALGGGCQLPLGALALIKNQELHLRAAVCSPDGRRTVRAQASGPASDPIVLGRRIAEDLAKQGAAEILDAARRATGPVEGSY